MNDEELRRFNQMETNLQENTLEINEIKTVLMGPPPSRNNGVKGNVEKLTHEVKTAIDWGHDIWNVHRRDQCFGLEAVKVLEEKLADDKEALNNMAVTKINLRGVYIMSFLQFVAAIIVAFIMSGSAK